MFRSFFTVVVFLLMTIPQTFGQSNENKFIQEFFKDKLIQSKLPLIVSDIDNFSFKKALFVLATVNDTLIIRKKLENRMIVIDSVILSLEERIFLINKFEHARLQTDVFKYVPYNTLTSIFKDKSKGWDFFRKTYGSEVHHFSIPIFFRNNTLCAFYYGNLCGSWCGSGILAIYRKENEKWVPIITLYRIIS
ncbi:MAG: hypothetical protein U0X91_19260 [Spirosomataceae bacterium]